MRRSGPRLPAGVSRYVATGVVLVYALTILSIGLTREWELLHE